MIYPERNYGERHIPPPPVTSLVQSAYISVYAVIKIVKRDVCNQDTCICVSTRNIPPPTHTHNAPYTYCLSLPRAF